MNERELARIVRGALDESVERLPLDTANRLAAARAAALGRAWTREARAPRMPREAGGPRTHEAAHAGRARGAGRIRRTALAGAPPRLVWRLAAIVVPVAFVTVGLLGISAWEIRQRADDLAELDAAMLVDDVPIAAYADRGFGVFLRNVSWEDTGK